MEIQSVLDVRDDNPLPKGSTNGPQFNRSILILTPERALKFTATSQERHYVWLTALSFLSHSPLGFGDLTALPSIPQQEYSAPRALGGSLRRNPIRDSIRVAKGRDPRGARAGQRSFTTDGVIPQYHPEREALYQPRETMYQPNENMYQPISDAAEPPTVPRYSSHSRHRSNTAPRAGPPSFRNFSTHSHTATAQPPPSTYSMTTATTSDVYTPSLYNGHHPTGLPSAKSSFSRRGSEASGSVAPNSAGAAGGYFDHVTPTMRMEAFISEEGGPRPRGSYRTRQGRKKDLGYWGVGDRVVSPMPTQMPGVDLPDEVVSNRSISPTVQAGHYPGMHVNMNMSMKMQIDGVSIMSEEGFEAKKHVIQEDVEYDDGHEGAHHFSGF